MDISRDFAEFVVQQSDRKCRACGATLPALSSTCFGILEGGKRCGLDNHWKKYDAKNYYEHMDLKSCALHRTGLHWCQHPAADCKLEDLIQTCVTCCRNVLDDNDVSRKKRGQ